MTPIKQKVSLRWGQLEDLEDFWLVASSVHVYVCSMLVSAIYVDYRVL